MKSVKFKAYIKSFVFTLLLLFFITCITVVDTNTKKIAGYINTGVFVDYNKDEISVFISDKNYVLSDTKKIKNTVKKITNILVKYKNVASLYSNYCNS